MLPKSRRALTIQEIAALARSSLHGISQVVKDHVTKPTAMAQGRVAHLIEWKGWCKPIDTTAALESDFNSYSDLTEGEQEARFAAGVAEQFAIAEAKLRAWSSVDGDESNDDSYDEDYLPANEPTTQSTDVPSYPPYLKDLIHSQLCQHLGFRSPCCESRGGGVEGGGSGEPSPTAGSPDTLCSSLCSLDEQHPLLRDLGGHRGTHSHSNAAELAAKILSALHGREELLLARLQRVGQSGPGGGDCGFQSLGVVGRGIRPCGGQDSPCYSMSYSDTYLSPGEDDDTPCKDYDSTVCQVEAERNRVEYPPDYDPRRRVSDVASSGVVSLDEEDEEEEEEEERAGEPNNQ
ncbi:protein FAM131A isoform X4 [Haplochromis burtoni]|uniref:Family with sequence similarity 131 member Ab n=2 Tax=Haplochromis burtoni TaxID=8153 RepID=A0A3Q2W0Z4_HAPBU|nr:protein FAM131A isoform X4 [Haplochromis burtoni]XP_005938365.1 protein FAM131A isoform X4 [Haplochromis burtoni]XP_005938368.1 protein FAM131A isoform X4 [Haplochromis burtoni]XP_042083269.1 protein FAM131A isoform X4 [Haplochromis burtoni]